MGYLSYGHESLIFIVVLLVASSVLLDLLPLLYVLARDGAKAPGFKSGTRFALIAAVCLLLSYAALS